MSLFIKDISLYNQPYYFFAILYPTSLVNLVVEVGTRHSHQILLPQCGAAVIDVGKSIKWIHTDDINRTNKTKPCAYVISMS